ncbi:MAG: hypothetical protein WB680_17270 [Candidatus Acidiferrales bacterium]
MTKAYRISLLSLLAVTAVFAIARTSNAQRARLGKVQSLQATSDSSGVHPASAAIAGPAKITCLNATSEAPNSRPAPSCHVVAPGFTGNLAKAEAKDLTAAGNVTLTCNGQGPMLRCTARVDIPPPSH